MFTERAKLSFVPYCYDMNGSMEHFKSAFQSFSCSRNSYSYYFTSYLHQIKTRLSLFEEFLS